MLSDLYGHKNHTEEAFVPNVQGIVRRLYEIAKELPAEGDPRLAPSNDHDRSIRTLCSLDVFLCQALLLTIRPIMLHVAQLILGGQSITGIGLDSSPLGKLCRTCSEAARKLLRVLLRLKEKKILGKTSWRRQHIFMH